MKSISILFAAFLAFNAVAADGVNVNGFADVQHQWSTNVSNRNGVTLNDAAIYVSKKGEGTEFMLDLPFYSEMAKLSPTAKGPDDVTISNAFTFATGKAQAWVSHKYASGFSWKLGQFDTIFGFEPNDSKDISFTTGAGIAGLLPTTHTGLMGSWTNDTFTVNVLAGNPNNQGRMGHESPEVAAQVAGKFGDFRGNVGYGTNKSSVGTSTLVDVNLGGTFGAIDADVEYAMRTFSIGLKGSDILATLGYKLNDTTSLGLRGEFMTLDGAKTNAFTFGPKIAMNKNLTCKTDYTYSMSGSAKEHKWNVAAVYAF